VLQAGKNPARRPPTYCEGDFNGDGVFNQLDIVAALQAGGYLPPLAAAGRGVELANAATDTSFADSENWFPSIR
jgi:hypothetical protein